jgi:hypothetical protein
MEVLGPDALDRQRQILVPAGTRRPLLGTSTLGDMAVVRRRAIGTTRQIGSTP